MPLTILSSGERAEVGDTWRAWLFVTDYDGVGAAPDAVAVTVGGASATVTAQSAVGLYLAEYDLAASGDYAIVVTVTDTDFGDDVENLFCEVSSPSDDTTDDAQIVSYLADTTGATAEAIADAITCERAAQRHVCRVPSPMPADLHQALKRRVSRNLAARAVPLSSTTSFEGAMTVMQVTRHDPEVARLEGPYRRLEMC